MVQPATRPLLAPPALRRLRGWHDVDAEIEEILEEDRAEKAVGFISVLKLFKMRSLRWQVISIIVLMAGQQLSGVNAVGSRCWGWAWSSAWTMAGAGTPREVQVVAWQASPWFPSRSTTTQTRFT